MDMDRPSRESELITVVRELVRELSPQRLKRGDVTLASRLDRDLGIDSLARTELVLRIERAFRLRLPVTEVAEMDSVADLLKAVEHGAPGSITAHAADVAAHAATPLIGQPDHAKTLTEMLDWHVENHADHLHVTVLQDENTVLGTMSYRDLQTAARAVAQGLISRDIVPGDRIAMMLPTSTDFFASFFGILYAGAVPVPIYPPARMAQLEEHMRRQIVILRNAGARMLITVPEGRALAVLLRSQVETLESVETVATLSAERAALPLPPLNDPEALGLMQYTSGSTGDPKGVMLTHWGLLENVRSMGHAMEASSADVFVSWLPLYHDMGLIGAWLGCCYFGARLYVMSPISFLVRPATWLWTMHKYRATFSGGPNFAFELCASRIPEEDLQGLDLSALRFVVNGAEPISPQTLRKFTDRFASYGMSRGVPSPSYGLAENCVGLCFPPFGRGPQIDRIKREQLARRGYAEPADANDLDAFEVVACGHPIEKNDVRIIDEAGRELGERQEGMLEFRGPSMTKGYFHNEAKTRELFHDGWIRSGDRAYMAGGDVHITGRVKDIIIRAGRNTYPHEIEEAISAIPGIRKGGVAAFGSADPQSGTERLIVMAETKETNAEARAKLVGAAHEVVTAIAGAAADDVVLVPPRGVPKTSSGKVRRSSAKELYETGRTDVKQHGVWLQIARLAFSSAGRAVTGFLRRIGDLIYAGWFYLVFALGFVLAWLAAMLLPTLSARWAVLHALARGALALAGIRVSVEGLERLPRGNAVILFNHTSYMDAVVIAAALPGEPAFIAKKEFEDNFFTRTLMKRVGVAFVERFDASASLADAEAVTGMAKEGRLFVFFPEGTFTRRAGLLGFYMGAFKVAAEAKLPVVPGVLRGVRTLLRGDQWFPRRTPISVVIEQPIVPTGTDFGAMLSLRDCARAAMLRHVGEPDLGALEKPPAPVS
ncbi:MAG TPA: AMP-binding protein [Xanthobacteraceae bacterium]|nr:AMP-binding protein [Xanthobacteraceae bacterium]